MSNEELRGYVELLSDYEQVKDKLFIRLSPISEDVIKTHPCHIVEDLMMTYHIYLPDDESGGFLSARITNNLLEIYGITPETLHSDALSSTPKIMHPKVTGLAEAVGISDDPGDLALVVTNETCVYGASTLFIPGIMDEIAGRVGGSYFVLPSSQHEFIIVPETLKSDVSELYKMVEEANEVVVSENDYLSSSVYYYDQETHCFKTAKTNETYTSIA